MGLRIRVNELVPVFPFDQVRPSFLGYWSAEAVSHDCAESREMTEVFSRAEALKVLIGSPSSGILRSSYEEAVLSCSGRLIEVGSPDKAVELIDALIRNTESRLSVRVYVVLARAKLVAQDFSGALLLIQTVLRDYSDELSLIRSDHFLLTTYEGGALRHLNRVSESRMRLQALYTELLALPDSECLGWCAYQLANTELVRGDRDKAKRYVLEAIVSAR